MNLFSRIAPAIMAAALLISWLPGFSDGLRYTASASIAPAAAAFTGAITSTTHLNQNYLSTQDAPLFGANPLTSPANGSIETDSRPGFDWQDASGGVLTYTLVITTPHGQALTRTTTTSAFTPSTSLPINGQYAWTVQAANAAGSSGFVLPANTFTLSATWRVLLPIVQKSPACPTTSSNGYDAIPFDGPRADRPGPEHADLNLALRGYSETSAPMQLVLYNGGTDFNAPQLEDILNGLPPMSNVFRVNNWIWTGSYPDPGTVGGPITTWDVTLLEFDASYGAPLYIPDRYPEIYGGGFKAMVLYAEENRITLGYTRDDTVANGYTVHLENICVDPNLLALYRAQTDSAGWHVTGHLPALRSGEQLGTAFVGGVRVAIRDRGAFMDPRSQKDWWRNYVAGLEIQKSHDTSLK